MAEPETLIGGRFRLGELLGVGGSASVFAAEDLSSERGPGDGDVAVKVLHPHLSAKAASRGAFLEEAAAVAHLRHPNIATVYASGVHDAGGMTMAWIALELVSGGSLADRVASTGPMRPAEAAAVLDGVLSALAAAHAAGLVHRDVSPTNVLLEPIATGVAVRADQVRLVDFGLADLTGRPSLGSDVLRSGTGSTGVVGNALYMSPEHALGRPVRAAGDLYQAGALLHLLLTGRPPYERDSTTHVLEAHVSAPPPVPSALVAAARPLDRVVTRAMTKTPARRFRDAEEFRAALVAALASQSTLVAAAIADTDGDADADPDAGTAATTVMPMGRTGSLDYLGAGTDATGPTDAERPRSSTAASSSSGGFALLVGVVLLSLATWGVVAANTDVDAAPAPSASVTATPTPTVPPPSESAAPPPSPTAPPIPTPSAAPPELVSVPAVFGTIADAEAALAAVGLSLGDVRRVDSAEPADRVLAQHPQPGESVAPGSSVDLEIAAGTNRVPPVAGMTVAGATAVLESAGFGVEVEGGPSSLAVVTGTEPGTGAVLRVGVTVAIIVATPTPEPSSSVPPESAPDQGVEP